MAGNRYGTGGSRSRTLNTGRSAGQGRMRDAYVYGAAAPQRGWEYEQPQRDRDRRQERGSVQQQASRQSRMIARRNRERAAHMNPGYLIFMAVLMGAMCFILISYIRLQADLTSSVKSISSLESQLSTLKAANDEKYNKINSSIDLDEIKYTAVTKLGMRYAQKDQIIRVQNDSEDYVKQVGLIGD